MISNDLFAGIGDVPTLTKKETIALFKERDTATPARVEEINQQILGGNIKLAIQQALKRTKPDHIETEDIIAEALVGMRRAIEKFEWQRGNAFSTYAVPWIKQSISKFIAETRSPISLNTTLIYQMRQDEENNSYTTRTTQARKALNALSIDENFTEEYEFSAADTIDNQEDFTDIYDSNFDTLWAIAEKHLTDFERELLIRRWSQYSETNIGHPITFAELAEQMGEEASIEIVRRAHNFAVSKLKRLFGLEADASGSYACYGSNRYDDILDALPEYSI